MEDDHIQELCNSEYHSQGACVIRHSNARNEPCKYEKNGYDATVASRAADYKVKLTPAMLQSLSVRRPKNVTDSTPLIPGTVVLLGQQAQVAFDPDMWNVDARADGANPNFKPKGEGGVGFHYPYLHNWHHLIGNEMLYKLLLSETHGVKLLLVLMAAKYNLNGPDNIALLPKQAKIGEIARWPVHPNNHPGFDSYAQEKLLWLKKKLNDAFSQAGKEVHKVNPQNVANVKENLNKISRRLYEILRRMGLSGAAGKHINEIETYGRFIEKRLGELRLTA